MRRLRIDDSLVVKPIASSYTCTSRVRIPAIGGKIFPFTAGRPSPTIAYDLWTKQHRNCTRDAVHNAHVKQRLGSRTAGKKKKAESFEL